MGGSLDILTQRHDILYTQRGMNHMFKVIYTYASFLPESLGEARHMNLGEFETVDAARDYILSEFDQTVAKYDDDGEAEYPTEYLSKHYAKAYSIEAV